jgi:HK97 family phage portal protein
MAHYELIRPRRDTWWQRAKRSITLGPWNPKDREIARYFGGTPVNSGVTVNEETMMSYSAVWAAVNLVSAHISSVPLVLYKVLPNGGKDRFVNHPLYRLVHDRPNPLMGSALFRRAIQTSKMVWGEGFAEIERDASDRPVNLWPLLSYQMQPFFRGNELLYRYRNGNGNDVIFNARDVLHIRAHTETGIQGISAGSKARESFGLAIAAERFGGSFFGNGSTFGGIIKYPQGINLTPQAKEDNRKALDNRHQGVDRAYRLLAIYEGAEYQQMGIAPNEAQFLETRMFQVEEVARWFNIPPHKLKHLQRTSYNSIEHQSIEYVTDALDPDWVLWEQELNLKLVSPLEMNIQRIEHVREGMLRGDSAARSQLQSSQFSIAGVTPNEVRAMENRNPVPGGDEPFVNLQSIPLSMAPEYWGASIDLIKANAEKARMPPPPPPTTIGGGDDRAIKALEGQLVLARHATQLAEDARDLALNEIRCEREARAEDKIVAADALRIANGWVQHYATRQEGHDGEIAAALAQVEEAKDALDAALAERDLGLASLTSERAARVAAEEALAIANTSLHDAASREQALIQERDAALSLADEVVKERDTARTEGAALREQVSAGEGTIADLREQLGASAVLADALTKERDALSADAEALRTDLARARADIATELDNQQAMRVALEAERDEAKDAGQQLAIKLSALEVALDHAKRDVGIVRQEAAGSALALETERQVTAAQRANLLASMRVLFVDASERLLQKESDRARKHQTTAEKLRAWVEGFYPMHMETVRATFRPLVGAWTAVAGGDPAALLERLVSEHIESSKRSFAHVLDAEDDDQRATALERTLRRWEDERAEAMADALVREGMAGHG